MVDTGVILHATCVAIAGRGVLITGPSGSGKSSLALQLMSLGAALVSDDRTVLHREEGALIAAAPAAIAGMIEARGVGILAAQHVDCVPLAVVIDLASVEVERLPERHVLTVLDIELPCLHKVDAPYFPTAIYTYIKGMKEETI